MKKSFYIVMLLIGLGGISLQLWLQKKKNELSQGPAIVEMGTTAGRASQAVEADGSFKKFKTVPEFDFTDRSGARMSLGDLKGKVWLANFIYTTCPSTCPALSNRFSAIQDAALAAEEVRLVSFSVDPEHDTPPVLNEYATALGAKERWHFLTGPKEQIERIAVEGFLIGFQRVGDKPEDIIHSTKIALVDRNGVVRRYYEGVGEDETKTMLADLKKLLEEKP